MGNCMIVRKHGSLREKHFDINQASNSNGSWVFTINIDTGEKIIGLKDTRIKTTQSGGAINDTKFTFDGNTVTVTGGKIHTYNYWMVGEFTILY